MCLLACDKSWVIKPITGAFVLISTKVKSCWKLILGILRFYGELTIWIDDNKTTSFLYWILKAACDRKLLLPVGFINLPFRNKSDQEPKMVIKLEDEDYITFLNEQNAFADEIKDPVYKVFLEHLSKDGCSYVFKMEDGDNGLPTTIKYEGEDNLSEKDERDAKTNHGNISFKGRDRSPAKKVQKKSRSCRRSGEAVELSSFPNEQSKPEESYLTFLNHLKFNDSSMILELDSVLVIYEEEKETPIVLAPENNVNSLVVYSSTGPSNITVSP